MSNQSNETFSSFSALKQRKSRVSQSIFLVLGTCQMYLKSNSCVGLAAVVGGKLSTLTPQPWRGKVWGRSAAGAWGAGLLLHCCARGSVPHCEEREGGRARPACALGGSCLGRCRPVLEVKRMQNPHDIRTCALPSSMTHNML